MEAGPRGWAAGRDPPQMSLRGGHLKCTPPKKKRENEPWTECLLRGFALADLCALGGLVACSPLPRRAVGGLPPRGITQ